MKYPDDTPMTQVALTAYSRRPFTRPNPHGGAPSYTAGQIRGMSDAELLREWWLGPKALREIRKVLVE